MIADNLVYGVWARGKPEPNEPVHGVIPATRDGCHPDRVLCGYGSFHAYMTNEPELVTCDRCKEKMAGGGES